MRRMKVFPRHWADCNTTDFAELDPQQAVAVLPLGATEQHGPHLPLSVDTDLVNAMVQAALLHLQPADQVLVLPTQSVGLSSEHLAYDGTLSLSPAAVIEQWCALGESVARVGLNPRGLSPMPRVVCRLPRTPPRRRSPLRTRRLGVCVAC